jgi:metallo-beta-lactamase family protein
MKITFCGAAGGVTGSAFFLEADPSRVLVDCGMFQGGRKAEEANGDPLPFDPSTLDAVLLTHAHLDHCGRLPLLIRGGYRGKVFATEATRDIAELILRDSVKIQENDIARANRKRERSGEPPLEPIYNLQDVEILLSQFELVKYNDSIAVAQGMTARFVEAGHMLGSSSIELKVQESASTKTVVFSGDLGPQDFPIVREAVCLDHADVVVMESTYGNRDHRSYPDTLKEFREIIQSAVAAKGKILVPAFAVGRTQQILCHLAVMFENKEVERFPIYLDSPMAIEATRIYRQHPDLYDEEAQELRRSGVLDRQLEWVRQTPSVDESRALNDLNGPCLIMAGSGMCTGGRILHHLKQNLWKPDTHVVIVGYQTVGSLGRRLVDREESVNIFGERVLVRAKIHTLNGFSAHAGQTELLDWFDCVSASKPRVILTHGEDEPRKALAKKIRDKHDLQVTLPQLGDIVTC